MEGRFSELELEFIGEVLDQHGEYLTDLFLETIEEKDLIDEQNLIQGIDYRTTKYGINPVLTFTFPSHGRFIEIRFHKKRKDGSAWNILNEDANKAIWGRQNRKRQVRRKKDTRWYSKNLYGSINRLIAILMNEFTDEEKERLKKILEYRNTLSK